jgi:hypothetical protein
MSDIFTRPRFGSIPAAVEHANGTIGRSKLYELAAKHPGLFRKLNSLCMANS